MDLIRHNNVHGVVFLIWNLHQAKAYGLGGVGSGVYEVGASPFDEGGQVSDQMVQIKETPGEVQAG